MALRREVSILLIAVAVALGSLLTLVLLRHIWKPITIEGAVIQQSKNAMGQSPISDVSVDIANNLAAVEAKSDFTGYFRLTLRSWVRRGQQVTITFSHPDYVPLTVKGTAGDALYVVRMAPVHPHAEASPNHPPIIVSNVIVRYFMETTTTENIGSGVKIFQVINTGNVPCDHAPVCSPDNRWKANDVSVSLDAGLGNEFRNARVSCIAGPCPFTKIKSDHFSGGGRTIGVTIRDWSDTTTFVLQSEVFHVQVSDIVRQYYPTIVGRTLNFTLPPAASGLTVEAELNGTQIDFPLGPNPEMSWADCKVSTSKQETKVYRCELEPWYQF